MSESRSDHFSPEEIWMDPQNQSGKFGEENKLILLSGIKTVAIDFFIIQGDSGGICTTLGNDSMSDSKQKSS